MLKAKKIRSSSGPSSVPPSAFSLSPSPPSSALVPPPSPSASPSSSVIISTGIEPRPDLDLPNDDQLVSVSSAAVLVVPPESAPVILTESAPPTSAISDSSAGVAASISTSTTSPPLESATSPSTSPGQAAPPSQTAQKGGFFASWSFKPPFLFSASLPPNAIAPPQQLQATPADLPSAQIVASSGIDFVDQTQ